EIRERVPARGFFAYAEVAYSLDILGILLSELGRHADAEPLLRRALGIFEQLFEPRHPQGARGLDNLAHALSELGRHTEAEPLRKRVESIRRLACDETPSRASLQGGNTA